MLLLFWLLTSDVFAQYQQTPPQYAPSLPTFPKSRREKTLDELQKQKIKQEASKNQESAAAFTGKQIEWSMIPLVKKWIIVVALDREFKEIVHIGESLETSTTLPLLPDGDYFFYADGMNLDRHMGRSEVSQFTISTPTKDSGFTDRKIKIISPENETRLTPFPKFRISWTKLKDAVSYRLQFWDESDVDEKLHDKIIPKPRWITELKESWVEIHDVPYASFMYLDEGDYRFDITPIFKDDQGKKVFGEQVSSRIIITRNSFLRKKQMALRLGGGYAPRSKYGVASAASNLSGSFGGSMTQFLVEFESYFTRRFGFSFDGALDNITMGTVATPSLYNFGIDLHHRTYLSFYERGWIFDFFFGFKNQQFAEIESDLDPKKVSYPTILGPRFGFRFIKRFESPLEMQIKAGVFIPMQASSTVKPSDSTYGVLNYLGSLHLRYYASDDFAWWLGVLHEKRKFAYTPNLMTANTAGFWNINSLQLGVQFNN